MEAEAQGRVDLDIKDRSQREQARHNLAYEFETNRHNVQSENLGWFNAQESQRHNLVSEDISYFNAHENQRHNLVTEDQGQQIINETGRHNRATEGIGYANIRLGYANLREQSRHNMASESIGRSQVEVSRINADANMRNAATNAMNAYTNRADVSSRIKTNAAQVDKYNSDISLNRQKLRTEESQARLNDAQMWRNYSGIAKDVINTLDIFSGTPEINETNMWSN
jgi:hypothetical protein